jgi:hypothetical protein
MHSTFDRELYRRVKADVVKHSPGVEVMAAWVIPAGACKWEFHYRDFYWHGSAGGAFDARAKGWSAWLHKQGVTDYREQSKRAVQGAPARTDLTKKPGHFKKNV